jgi:hypothetical protein
MIKLFFVVSLKKNEMLVYDICNMLKLEIEKNNIEIS